MEGYAKCGGDIGSNKVWSNAVNTLLSAMGKASKIRALTFHHDVYPVPFTHADIYYYFLESILLDEDLQPLWSREHHGHDAKRRSKSTELYQATYHSAIEMAVDILIRFLMTVYN